MNSSDDQLAIVFLDDAFTVSKMTNYSTTSAFMTTCGEFSCEIFEPDFDKFRTLRDKIAIYGRRVQILVNGVLQMYAIVERTNIGDDGTCLTVAGRDYISDVFVSDLDKRLSIGGGTSLDKAVLKIFLPFGISKIDFTGNNTTRGLLTGLGKNQFKSLNSSITDPRKSILPDTRSEPNAKVFEFANKISAKQGFTIQPTTSIDTVSLCEPEYESDPIYFGLYRYLDQQNPKNNIVSGSVSRDFSECPTVITNYGTIPSSDGYDYEQANFERAVFSPVIDGVASPPALFPEIQNNIEFTRIFAETTVIGSRFIPGKSKADPNAIYRPSFFNDKKSTTATQLKNVMRRQLSGRFAKTLQCTYKVSGHTQNGIIWTTDTIVPVVDEVGGVEENLWIESRTFSYTRGEGATTTLKCWRLFSYIIGE